MIATDWFETMMNNLRETPQCQAECALLYLTESILEIRGKSRWTIFLIRLLERYAGRLIRKGGE